MKPLVLDHFVGSTKPLRFGLRDPATNLAANLSGLVDAYFIARNAADAIVLSYRLNTGITIVDPTGATTGGEESLLDVLPASADSLALTPGDLLAFDLWLKFADGKRGIVAWGDVLVRKASTRDFSGELAAPAAAFRISSDGLFIQLKDSVTGLWRTVSLNNGNLVLGPEVP